MKNIPIFFLITTFLIITAMIQIVSKYMALGPAGRSYLLLFFDPRFYVIGTLYILQTITWLSMLGRMPLTILYPITSMNLVFILPISAFFFSEPITIGNICGSLVIIAGIVVITGDKIFGENSG